MAKKETKKPEKTKEAKPPKAEKEKKGKKDKKGADAAAVPPTGAASTGIPSAGQASIPLSAMSPEQMTAAQLEQALKESNDPESRLKKLHSPISVKSCLLNLLILIILTIGIVILWCFLAVDKFNFVTVFKHMMGDPQEGFGITQGFEWLWNTIRGWFS